MLTIQSGVHRGNEKTKLAVNNPIFLLYRLEQNESGDQHGETVLPHRLGKLAKTQSQQKSARRYACCVLYSHKNRTGAYTELSYEHFSLTQFVCGILYERA